MKRVLAVVVSIFWLALIIGVPYLALTSGLGQFIPTQIGEQLEQLAGPELAGRLGLSPAQPSPEAGEPIVTVETATPLPEIQPTAVPTDVPTPTSVPQPTLPPLPSPTTQPTPDTSALPSVTIPVAVIGQADLRVGPGLDFDSVGLVAAGATVLVSAQDETGEWYQLENGNWLPAGTLANKPPVPIALANPVTTPDAATPATPDAAASVTPSAPATPVVVTVNADANLRSGPGGTFERVGGANFGTDVTVVGKFATDNWYLLDSGSWIFGELLASAPDVPQVNADGTPVGSTPAPSAPAPATPPGASAAAATANTLANLRAAPNTTATLTGSAQAGQTLVLVGKNAAGDWLKLENGSWIFAELVDNAPANLPVVGEDSSAPAETPAAEAPAAGETESPTPAKSSAAVDANLRSGPGTTFDRVGSITAGTALVIIGRNEAGDWLKLESGAWIFGELVNNPPADLPVAAS
ncbi:MAG: SH3 domain-containing protein [Caldilineaceae bacterium]|nr:SH3 domain-containing protein [Caldilineaceae bacterium]